MLGSETKHETCMSCLNQCWQEKKSPDISNTNRYVVICYRNIMQIIECQLDGILFLAYYFTYNAWYTCVRIYIYISTVNAISESTPTTILYFLLKKICLLYSSNIYFCFFFYFWKFIRLFSCTFLAILRKWIISDVFTRICRSLYKHTSICM